MRELIQRAKEDLPVCLCFNPQLQSWALGSGLNNEITSGGNMFPHCGEELGHPEGAWSRAAALSASKRSQLRWFGPP